MELQYEKGYTMKKPEYENDLPGGPSGPPGPPGLSIPSPPARADRGGVRGGGVVEKEGRVRGIRGAAVGPHGKFFPFSLGQLGQFGLGGKGGARCEHCNRYCGFGFTEPKNATPIMVFGPRS